MALFVLKHGGNRSVPLEQVNLADHVGMLADPEGGNRILLAIAEDRCGLQ